MSVRKIIVAAVVAGALLAGVFAILRAIASPEERIRSRLQEMADDFDAGRAGACVRGLAPGFRDLTTGYGAEEVRLFLAQMTLSERDPDTGALLHRVTLPDESMAIVIDPADPARARVDLIAVFEERRGDEWRLSWRVAIEAEMADGDDGWQIVSTTHETLEGRRF